MVGDTEVQLFGDGVLNFLYARITEFDKLTALCTNHVVVLFTLVSPFEMRHIFAKLMFDHQSAI